MALISLPVAPVRPDRRRPRIRRALALFVEEMTAAKRRAAVDDLEQVTARRVALWFVYQGRVVVEVLGRAMGDRMDRAAQEARAGRRLTEELSWSDWDYLLNQVMYGNHPGGLGELRDIITDGRTTAYAVGAESLLGELGLGALGMRFAVGSAEAVAHARAVAAGQVTRINDTTREQLRTLITQAVEHGWSWNRTAEAIAEKYADFAGKPLFPSKTFRSRAEMVAAYEIGDAYEEGNFAQARQAQTEGIPMEKAWLHAGDERVRRAHRRNAEQGWLALDATYPDGSERPPTDAGCRCAQQYRVRPGYFADEEAEGAAAGAVTPAFMPLSPYHGPVGQGVRRSPYRTKESEQARRDALLLRETGREIQEWSGRLQDMILRYEQSTNLIERTALATEIVAAEDRYYGLWDTYNSVVTYVLRVPDPTRFGFAVQPAVTERFPEMRGTIDEFASFLSSRTLPDDGRVTLLMLPPHRTRSVAGTDLIGIALDSPDIDRVLFHEMGHIIEAQNPAAYEAAIAFRNRRTAGQAPVNLNDYLGSRYYRSDEITLPDDFLNAYTGKVYVDAPGSEMKPATEVISTGLEMMRWNMEEVAARDPDFFHFMYHLMRGNYEVLARETRP